jgi:HK97 family phage major capsid protein
MDTADLKGALDAHLKAVDTAIEKYHGQLQENGKVSEEAKAEARATTERLAKLDDNLRELGQKIATINTGATPEPKSAVQEFVSTAEFKAFAAQQTKNVRLELKNTVINGVGTTFPFQRPGMIPGSFVPTTVRETLRVIPVTTNAVESLRELAWTNSAAEVSEGAAKPESDITFQQYDVPVRTIAHWIKMSVQLLADAPATAAYIEVRLRDGLAQRIDNQLINGNGTSPNLSGFTDSGNFTAYTATADDNLIDAINRIKWAMWAAGNAPDTVYVNPADWGALERLREGSNSGTYLYGAPGTAANANPFGLTVVPTPYLAAGKIIVARLSDSALLYQRSGAVIEMGYVNSDFTSNLVTVRAEERIALACDRPAGIYYGDWTA